MVGPPPHDRHGAIAHSALGVCTDRITPSHLDAFDARFGDLLFLDRLSGRALRHLVETGD